MKERYGSCGFQLHGRWWAEFLNHPRIHPSIAKLWLKIRCSSRWWNFNYFLFSPVYTWGNVIQVDYSNLFKMGWFNHQLDECFVRNFDLQKLHCGESWSHTNNLLGPRGWLLGPFHPWWLVTVSRTSWKKNPQNSQEKVKIGSREKCFVPKEHVIQKMLVGEI